MTSNYNLTPAAGKKEPKIGTFAALKKLLPLLSAEKRSITLSGIALLINSILNLVAPVLVGYAVDNYVQTKNYHGVLVFSAILFALFLGAVVVSYVQTKLMGGVGQRVLFKLRNDIFNKLQELPVSFFHQNKAGDLISRINNDTDKLNQFFSQALVQFVGSLFIMFGAGVFLIVIHPKLGLAALAPALFLVIFTQLISPWIKRKNAVNLRSGGGMSAEIQESLDNFKVIVAFHRQDYFREKFNQANRQNYSTAITAGLANNIFQPVYSFCSNLAQLIVLAYGIYLISVGNLTLGLLISFLVYITRFYDPLRQIAALWANFQVALAGWDRISDIMSLDSDLLVIPSDKSASSQSVLEFKNVHFSYPGGKEVLRGINFRLEPGKTYALVGPTGGGKTTTASLMARLYDPSEGEILLQGKDIRSYEANERTQKIGFILQEPFLFSGTVQENILYGNEQYQNFSTAELKEVLRKTNLENLVDRFEKGLETKIQAGTDSMSLGQKQMIAFIRAVLRNPALLILDEATANIDTVTEQLLEEILQKLPKSTTRVIIAHRLNTIENADEIFFINAGEVTPAGSMDDAVEMLLHGKRQS